MFKFITLGLRHMMPSVRRVLHIGSGDRGWSVAIHHLIDGIDGTIDPRLTRTAAFWTALRCWFLLLVLLQDDERRSKGHCAQKKHS